MFSVILIPLLVAMFLAVNMGGSGTAPSFSAAYGAKILKRGVIPGLFGVFVLLGAIVAGKEVVKTISKGILPDTAMTMTITTIILLSIALSLLFANLLKVPQSTSQATILALVGVALYFGELKTQKLFTEIIPTWFILPVVSFVLTWVIARFIYKPIRDKTKLDFGEISKHPALKFIVIASACYVAFAIGSNNVANASGPITAMTLNQLGIGRSGDSFLLCMILGTLIIAPCFGIGSSIFGPRVLKTTGREIVDFGPLGASLVSVVTASLLLLASVTRGIPTSLVQLNIAAILALGVSRIGAKGILTKTAARKLLIVWIIAPLISLSLALLFTFTADKIGLL